MGFRGTLKGPTLCQSTHQSFSFLWEMAQIPRISIKAWWKKKRFHPYHHWKKTYLRYLQLSKGASLVPPRSPPGKPQTFSWWMFCRGWLDSLCWFVPCIEEFLLFFVILIIVSLCQELTISSLCPFLKQPFIIIQGNLLNTSKTPSTDRKSVV